MTQPKQEFFKYAAIAAIFLAGCWRPPQTEIAEDYATDDIEVFNPAPALSAMQRESTVAPADSAIIWLAGTGNLRFMVMLFNTDTAGFTIAPRLRMQCLYVLKGRSSDWFELDCPARENFDNCDFWVDSNNTKESRQDTITIRMTVLNKIDPEYAAIWRFRFRAECEGKFSEWQYLPRIRIFSPARLGVPRLPIIRLLKNSYEQ